LESSGFLEKVHEFLAGWKQLFDAITPTLNLFYQSIMNLKPVQQLIYNIHKSIYDFMMPITTEISEPVGGTRRVLNETGRLMFRPRPRPEWKSPYR
jgi:hypothetical protein